MNKALLVGINNYKHSYVPDLRGCLNDVANMRQVLQAHVGGFDNKNVRVLADSRATGVGILERLHWLVSGAKSGDYILFHFSGHGSQVRDRDGDELTDSLDEILCPYDVDWEHHMITDDVLRDIFSRVPESALLEVVLDCCHSGTGIRSFSLFKDPEASIAKFAPPPLDIACRWEGENVELKTVRHAFRTSESHILWAGCRDKQVSYDAFIGGKYQGVLTHYMCKHIRKAPNVERATLFKRVRDSVKYNGYAQDPQLEFTGVKRMGAFGH